jgi:hypothetical protein
MKLTFNPKEEARIRAIMASMDKKSLTLPKFIHDLVMMLVEEIEKNKED